MKGKKEIIIGVAGGISAYKSCEIVRLLRKQGNSVTVLMTKEATHFIGPLTLQTLSGRPVIVDMFDQKIQWDPCHISLAKKADLVVIIPATANIIAKIAVGMCDDIISCVIMATKAKVIICPAMNENMYKHPALQENIKKLKNFGYQIIAPIKGELACGEVGLGHLASCDKIISEIKNALK